MRFRRFHDLGDSLADFLMSFGHKPRNANSGMRLSEKSSTCTPSFACPRASSRLTPASRPILFSSRRADRQRWFAPVVETCEHLHQIGNILGQANRARVPAVGLRKSHLGKSDGSIADCPKFAFHWALTQEAGADHYFRPAWSWSRVCLRSSSFCPASASLPWAVRR